MSDLNRRLRSRFDRRHNSFQPLSLRSGTGEQMRRDQRRVFFYDLAPYSRAKTPQEASLVDLSRVWERHWAAQEAHHTLAKGTKVFSIKDFSQDADHITMLLSVIDKDMPDMAYGDLDTRETTIFAKNERQGNNLTAHLIITKNPQFANRYVCCLEGVPKLTASSISALLSKILRDAYHKDKKEFSYPDPGGARENNAVRRIGYLPYVRLLGHVSPRMIGDLEAGRVRSIELVKSYEVRPHNDDPYIREEKTTLKLAVDKRIPREGRWDHLKGALRLSREVYASAYITFVAPDGIVKDFEYDMESDSVDNESYIKSDLLDDIEPPLGYAANGIVEHFVRRMKTCMADGGEA